jgi:2-hydroxy-3-keto-5-methylthiopentenyl-1-phosphate phosphatase
MCAYGYMGAKMDLHFAVDFDGTVTLRDTTDYLLERFADKAWLDVEEEWVSGRIGSRECLARQVALIKASRSQIVEALDEIEVDPRFPEFVAAVRGLGASIEIVSDGFDFSIETILDRYDLDLPVRSNRLCWLGGSRWRAEWPYGASDCRAMSGVCKCRVAKPGRFVVHIGDSRSDFCLAGQAGFVLAKGALASHCRERGYPHLAIDSFADAIDWISALRASGSGANVVHFYSE